MKILPNDLKSLNKTFLAFFRQAIFFLTNQIRRRTFSAYGSKICELTLDA